MSFAANSLITRHVVAARLMDPGLLSAARFIAGAVALVAIAFARRDRPRLRVGRANVMPAAWLGVYALCISYGYHYIGAAAGTFVFYTAVLLTLVAHDVATGTGVQASRVVGVVVALSGIAVLALGSDGRVTALGVLLLAVTGVSWGLYTVAGRSGGDPRVATTGNFVVVAAVVVAPATVGAAIGLRLTFAGVVWAVVMGALTTALAYVAWYACQRLDDRDRGRYGSARGPRADRDRRRRVARRAGVGDVARRRRARGDRPLAGQTGHSARARLAPVSHTVEAELVANVLEVCVEVGSVVAAEDPVVLLESMKMEIPVLAEVAGVVIDIRVAQGDVVNDGDPLAIIAPA